MNEFELGYKIGKYRGQIEEMLQRARERKDFMTVQILVGKIDVLTEVEKIIRRHLYPVEIMRMPRDD